MNERQYVSLRAGLDPAADRLDHVALETDDAEAMRRYLAARGVEVPASSGKDESGNPAFTVRDPEGWTIELVQHAADTWPRRAPAGEAGRPLSRRILHAGIIVGDLAAANRFYGEILGLTETWRGSRSGTELSWTNMKVPDGDDYLEFMLYGRGPRPTPAARRTTSASKSATWRPRRPAWRSAWRRRRTRAPRAARGHQPQAAAQPVRRGRDARRADGAADGGRAAGAALHRAAAEAAVAPGQLYGMSLLLTKATSACPATRTAR